MNPRKQSELDKMFDHQTVYNAYAALIAGLITSAHCVAMCGPLSCAFTPTKMNYSNPQLGLIAALVVAWRLRTTLGIEGAEDWVCHPF